MIHKNFTLFIRLLMKFLQVGVDACLQVTSPFLVRTPMFAFQNVLIQKNRVHIKIFIYEVHFV